MSMFYPVTVNTNSYHAMVINEKADKIYNYFELLFVEILFVGKVFVSCVVSSHIITESLILLPSYLPSSQVHIGGFHI